ncbi:MAG: SLC13 family permease [Halieaceae bacterium]
MWSDSTSVFLLIAVTAVLMASNRLRFDIVALLVVISLMLSGILTVGEALAGFGSPVVMLVACLLVVGEMLDRTGVAAAIGNWILKKGGSNETRLYIVIMTSAGLLGAVMSSTAVVAIFIPIVMRVAAETKLQASRLLMPMSYAALISGMLTLIATTPNLVVSEELKGAGYSEFGFFSFTPVGLAVLVVAIAYILLLGRHILPKRLPDEGAAVEARSVLDIWEDYCVDREHRSCTIDGDSPLAGHSISDSALETEYGVRVLGVVRQRKSREERLPSPPSSTVLEAGDTLLCVGRPGELDRFMSEQSLRLFTSMEQSKQRWLWELGAATVLVHPESELIGKSLSDAEFRSRYNLHALGLRRDRQAQGNYESLRLAPSDNLFLVGPWSAIRQLQSRHHDFVVMETPAEQQQVVPAYRHMRVALAILAAMVLLSILNVIPLVATVIIAALAAVFTRCMAMDDAYRSIHWSSLVLVAGMLPMADALEKTGGTAIIVQALMQSVGDGGPGIMLTVIFFLTAGLGLFLSNTASAVLVAPIAIYAAESLGVSPYPFAVAVLIAASAAFVTPVSTPVVTLVVEPGRYQFMDFVKVGVPLLFLTWLTTLLVAPLIFPYSAS